MESEERRVGKKVRESVTLGLTKMVHIVDFKWRNLEENKEKRREFSYCPDREMIATEENSGNNPAKMVLNN